MKLNLSYAAGAIAGILSALSLFRLNPNKVNVLRWKEIIEWFADKSSLKTRDKDNIAFTLLRRPQVRAETGGLPLMRVEEVSTATVILVQGILNKRSGSIIDARVLEAAEMDDEIAEAHKDNELVIYE
jgi:hypothetical protein